jgi:hypothetical protein
MTVVVDNARESCRGHRLMPAGGINISLTHGMIERRDQRAPALCRHSFSATDVGFSSKLTARPPSGPRRYAFPLTTMYVNADPELQHAPEYQTGRLLTLPHLCWHRTAANASQRPGCLYVDRDVGAGSALCALMPSATALRFPCHFICAQMGRRPPAVWIA